MRILSPETTVLATALDIVINISWGSANGHGIHDQQKGYQKSRRGRNKETWMGGKKRWGEKERRRETGGLVLFLTMFQSQSTHYKYLATEFTHLHSVHHH